MMAVSISIRSLIVTHVSFIDVYIYTTPPPGHIYLAPLVFIRQLYEGLRRNLLMPFENTFFVILLTVKLLSLIDIGKKKKKLREKGKVGGKREKWKG